MKTQKFNAQFATNYDLAVFAQQTCLALLRRKDSWTAASSTSEWFKEDDSGKAESTYNDWANREAVKFEKEYYECTKCGDDIAFIPSDGFVFEDCPNCGQENGIHFYMPPHL